VCYSTITNSTKLSSPGSFFAIILEQGKELGVILKMARFCAFVITSEAIDTEEKKRKGQWKSTQ